MKSNLKLRRILDVTLALALLVILSPLLLVIALLVRLSSPGPVLYRARVVGWRGCEFSLYKFRTMRAGTDQLRRSLADKNEAEWPLFKMRNDPRVTSFGSFLRRHSLDELPQLWNILRGEMTFIGPRPVLKEEWEAFNARQRQKLNLKPGAFSLWLIHGQPRDLDTWVKLDLEYERSRSLRLDLKILFRSLWFMLAGKNY